MKCKSMLACLLAVSVLFASCGKESDNGESGVEIGTVRITVAPGEPARGSRAEAGKVSDGEAISLGEGYIFFTNSNGVIVRHVRMVNGTPGTGEIALGNLTTTGETISDVSTSAARCYVFSKVPSTVTMPAIVDNQTNISVIKGLAMNVTDLYDATDNGVAQVPLWGEGNVINTTNPMTVAVNLYAMGARLQIEKLTGTVDIEGYRLEGIFINNFYQKMSVGYTAPDPIVNHGSDVSVYVNASTQYAAYASLFDYKTTGLATMTGNTVATPIDGGEVWAYNIWPTEGMAGANAETMPHIIFVMKDVVYNNGTQSVTIAEPLYLTVTGMKAGSTPVATIAKGNSYTFSNIAFQFSDLDLVPEVRSVDATVTITAHPWKDTAVEPEL